MRCKNCYLFTFFVHLNKNSGEQLFLEGFTSHCQRQPWRLMPFLFLDWSYWCLYLLLKELGKCKTVNCASFSLPKKWLLQPYDSIFLWLLPSGKYKIMNINGFQYLKELFSGIGLKYIGKNTCTIIMYVLVSRSSNHWHIYKIYHSLFIVICFQFCFIHWMEGIYILC